jgi:hypothetical protein
MPRKFENITIGVEIEGQLPFLRSLAAAEGGGVSKFIRRLIKASPEYQAFIASQQP